MASTWDDLVKTVREGVDTVVEKTEELTKIGKIKVEIINIKRHVDKNFAELGGNVYHMIVEDDETQIAGNTDVKSIVERIRTLEQDLDRKNEQLEQVKVKDKKDVVKQPEAAS